MMRKLLNSLFKPLVLGLAICSLALPDASYAAEKSGKTVKVSKKQSKSGKKVSSKKASKKKAVAKRKSSRKAPRVSRSGQSRNKVAAAPARPYIGPTQIVQIADASSPLLLESRAALIMDAETGDILYGKNSDRSLPIASITKLMTAMVVLDAQLPMQETITITEAEIDRHKNTSSRLAVGTNMTRQEAMLLALMSSENRAAAALGRTYPGGVAAAVEAMNRKARSLGMEHSFFADTTGLRSENKASPRDLVLMVQAAHQYPAIRQFSTQTEYDLATHGRTLHYRNTNALVKNSDWEIGVSKTGFINEAGKCLVMQAKVNHKPVVIVLMDSWGSYTRIGDANRVKKWLESAVQFGG